MEKNLNHNHKIIFGLAGYSGSGKTILSEKLIRQFSKLKISVASIKHAHHNFEVDIPGKDSWKHRKAGSKSVIISSKNLIAHIQDRKSSPEAKLEELLNMLPPKEIVLIEGFKKEKIDKIEVFRKGLNKNLLAKVDKNIFAIATDMKVEEKVFDKIKIPIIPLNDIETITNFILNHFKRKNKTLKKINNNNISFDSAKKLIFKNITTIEAEELYPIEESRNRVLSKSIKSKIYLPPNPNSAVDGYGFNFKDYNQINGTTFYSNKKIKAGDNHNYKISNGEAVKILTGAVLPKGVNTIAMFEDCSIDGNKIYITPGLKKNVNFRPKGENIKKNEIILKLGTKISSTEIAQAASAGIRKFLLKVQPKVGIISTGNELTDHKESLKFSNVFDSNGPMLADLVKENGYNFKKYKIVRDKVANLKKTLLLAIKNNNAIIISGGASNGDEDYTRKTLDNLNAKIIFWGLNIKPGRPMGFATIDQTPIFCLPGNPVAAFICFKLLVIPGLEKLIGQTDKGLFKISTFSKFSHKSKYGRREFLRGKLAFEKNKIYAFINGRPGAGVLSSVIDADGIIDIPEEITEVFENSILSFIPFGEIGI